MKDIYQVIKKVRISEKATMLQETTGELVFEVDRDANKIEIKKDDTKITVTSDSIKMEKGSIRAYRQL